MTISHSWPPMVMLQGNERQLVDELRWHDGEQLFVVPRGFVCDLASVPRLLWWWAAPDGPYRAAVVVHDLLYRTQPCTRKQADKTMLQIMRHVSVRRTQARLIWIGVRLFGWWAWRQNGKTAGSA